MSRIAHCLLVALAMLSTRDGWAIHAAPAKQAAGRVSAVAALEQATIAAADTRRYRVRGWLRDRIVSERDGERYGLQLQENWQAADSEKPIVVLIHGFNSSPTQNVALLELIQGAEFPCGNFAYPNDHSILSSAQLLSSELRRFRLQHPERRLVLVCHSMGGLVARACIEDSLYDPGNVERLIMIAPPTHGSLVAHFAVGTDLYEHWIARRSGGPWARVRDSVIDGMGEAADELCPNSEFLLELNARPLNPRVRYTNLLGSGAPISEAEVLWMRESVCERLARVPGVDGCALRLQVVLDDIDELVDGKGDGVVAIKRGRLDGVSDTLVMPFGHVAVTRAPRDESDDSIFAVHEAVLVRLD